MDGISDIIEAARQIRLFLIQLTDEECIRIKGELDKLIKRYEKGYNVETGIIKILSQNNQTNEWLIKFLKEKVALVTNYIFLKQVLKYLPQIKEVSGQDWSSDYLQLFNLLKLGQDATKLYSNLNVQVINSEISPDLKLYLQKIAYEVKDAAISDNVKILLEQADENIATWENDTSKMTDTGSTDKPIFHPIEFSEINVSSTNISFNGRDLKAINETVLANLIEQAIQLNAETSVEPPARYADFIFYKEKPSGEKGNRLESSTALKIQNWYHLEVAVHEIQSGIKSEGDPRPIREPKQSGNVNLLVTAESEDFEISEPVQFLTLPPKGDSTDNAFFRVRPLNKTSSASHRAVIRLRIYYKFNLIEDVAVYAEVVDRHQPESSKLTLANPITYDTIRKESELIDLDNIVSRQMHIKIAKKNSNYIFTFIFPREMASGKEEEPLAMIAPVRISQAELESDLVNVRRALLAMTTSDVYINNLENKDEANFAEFITPLAKLGSNLWTKLFRLDCNSALWNVGIWLKENPLAQNSKIQISQDSDASDFIFPWNLIYDGELPDENYEPPKPNGFWGLKYEIEQRLPGHPVTDAPINCENGFEIGFMLWRFKQASAQESLIKNLTKRGKGRVALGAAIMKSTQAYRYLENCRSHIIYFFTHGHTELLASNLSGTVRLDDFLSFYHNLPVDSPQKQSLKGTYEKMLDKQFQADRSWIELDIGKIYLDDLQRKQVNLKNHPVVILNMCESAQVTPSMARNSFIHFFLNRGASAVVGTECLMTSLFAHHFSEKLLETFLSGNSIGESMCISRRDFFDLRNPLGLAYTLFGTTTKKLVPPPLQI